MLGSKNIKFKILKRLNPELKISKGPQNPELQDSEFNSQKLDPNIWNFQTPKSSIQDFGVQK